jgi:hypothetical protein
MSWVAKVLESNLPGRAAASPLRGPGPGAAMPSVRPSNGLKEFLGLLTDIERGGLLDLGPAWQSTLTFFLDRGFRVSAEDLFCSWKEFGAEEESRRAVVATSAEAPSEAATPAARAEKFLGTALAYPAENFNAILAWDLFDYLDGELAAQLAARLYQVLRPGGSVLAIFHGRPPDSFHRYRVAQGGIEMVPAPAPLAYLRALQNREILNLFAQFRSAKTIVGRDQLREGLFLK